MFFFFSSRRRHTRLQGDWSSDVCSSDLAVANAHLPDEHPRHKAEASPSSSGLWSLASGPSPSASSSSLWSLASGFSEEPRSEERRVGRECGLLIVKWTCIQES